MQCVDHSQTQRHAIKELTPVSAELMSEGGRSVPMELQFREESDDGLCFLDQTKQRGLPSGNLFCDIFGGRNFFLASIGEFEKAIVAGIAIVVSLGSPLVNADQPPPRCHGVDGVFRNGSRFPQEFVATRQECLQQLADVIVNPSFGW